MLIWLVILHIRTQKSFQHSWKCIISCKEKWKRRLEYQRSYRFTGREIFSLNETGLP